MRLVYWAGMTFVITTPLYPWATAVWAVAWAAVVFAHTSKPRSSGATRTEGTETSDASWPR